MIKIYPTNPGKSKQWTVEIDFSENGLESKTIIADSWEMALLEIGTYLKTPMSF